VGLSPDDRTRVAEIADRLAALGTSWVRWELWPNVRDDEDAYALVELVIADSDAPDDEVIASELTDEAVANFLVGAPGDVRFLLDLLTRLSA
jgi:hypothetical protein